MGGLEGVGAEEGHDLRLVSKGTPCLQVPPPLRSPEPVWPLPLNKRSCPYPILFLVPSALCPPCWLPHCVLMGHPGGQKRLERGVLPWKPQAPASQASEKPQRLPRTISGRTFGCSGHRGPFGGGSIEGHQGVEAKAHCV